MLKIPKFSKQEQLLGVVFYFDYLGCGKFRFADLKRLKILPSGRQAFHPTDAAIIKKAGPPQRTGSISFIQLPSLWEGPGEGFLFFVSL
jgi:hypothetical protein